MSLDREHMCVRGYPRLVEKKKKAKLSEFAARKRVCGHARAYVCVFETVRLSWGTSAAAVILCSEIKSFFSTSARHITTAKKKKRGTLG